MEHAGSHAGAAPAGTTYNISLQVDGPVRAGEAVQLSFVVTEQKVGDPLQHFELLHERLMHLIIVDESLAYFAHVHPTLETETFRVTHSFPAAGAYKLWAECKPSGGEAVLAAFRMTASGGATAHPAQEPASDAGYQVRLLPSTQPRLHEPVELAFEVADTDGRPVTDLEPLMAAGGHCVVISADLKDFVHVHPLEEVEHGWRGGPRVSFVTSFHRAVPHRVWGQFQRRGELITAGFDIDVVSVHH